ncbi:MAG: Sulfotransferase domain protein [Ilumatobacteraceae bacterium]|nr:Sulfotransferase domain protein [Ilumatobacteraceae bacterium]
MTTVVYLGAVGRSGTTLLERVAATSPSFVSLGEMVHLWERGVQNNEPCGCGLPLHSCPVWTPIVQQAFGGWQAIDIEQIQEWRRSADRNRYIPFLLMPRLAPRKFREAMNGLLGVLDPLYTAIGQVAGPGVIAVDASKHPSYFLLIRKLPSHDVRLLHIIRDPRGVAHSWAKSIRRPESRDGDDMEQLGTVHAVARWISHNVLFTLGGIGVRHRRMRYERFAADPTELSRALGALTADLDVQMPTFHGNSIDLVVNHTVSGNPMRFNTGPVVIRRDDSWRTAMPHGKRFVVSLLTFPLRLGYRS